MLRAKSHVKQIFLKDKQKSQAFWIWSISLYEAKSKESSFHFFIAMKYNCPWGVWKIPSKVLIDKPYKKKTIWGSKSPTDILHKASVFNTKLLGYEYKDINYPKIDWGRVQFTY